MTYGRLYAPLHEGVARLYYKLLGLPHYGNQVRYRHLKKKLSGLAGGEVIDVGCGDGILLNQLALTKKVRGVGIDRLAQRITTAACVRKRYGLKNKFLVSDFELNFSQVKTVAKKADGVLCLEVLEHVRSPQKLMKNMIALLKPGGRIIISTPLIPRRKYLSDIKQRFDYGPDRHVVEGYDFRELSRMVDQAGGKISSVEFTFRLFGQSAWEVSQKLRRHRIVSGLVLPLLLLIERLDAIAPKHTANGVILTIENNAQS